MMKKIFLKGYIYLVLAFMYIPLLVLFVYSFNSSPALGDWSDGVTFKVYGALFTGRNSQAIWSALGNTVIIAVASGVLSLVLGTLGAIGVDKMKKKLRNTISTAAKLPIINAEVITALSFMIFIASLGLQPSLASLIIAHTAFCTPYVLLSVLPKLQQVNNNTYEAALDLGATPVQALSKVILPQILPAMISGFLIALTISVDDFIVTQFNKGDFETLSTYVYTAGVKRPLPPEVRALSVIIFVFALLILYVAYRTSNKNNKKENNI